MPIKREGGGEVQNWLKEAMKEYNFASFENRDSYPAVIHMPGKILDKVIKWCFESLPDEVLVGIDVDNKSPINQEVSLAFCNQGSRADLFAGQDYVIGEAEIVNRGDSFSVHHLPEDWTDGIFTESRGARGGGLPIGYTPIQMRWQSQALKMQMQPKVHLELTSSLELSLVQKAHSDGMRM